MHDDGSKDGQPAHPESDKSIGVVDHSTKPAVPRGPLNKPADRDRNTDRRDGVNELLKSVVVVAVFVVCRRKRKKSAIRPEKAPSKSPSSALTLQYQAG